MSVDAKRTFAKQIQIASTLKVVITVNANPVMMVIIVKMLTSVPMEHINVLLMKSARIDEVHTSVSVQVVTVETKRVSALISTSVSLVLISAIASQHARIRLEAMTVNVSLDSMAMDLIALMTTNVQLKLIIVKMKSMVVSVRTD